MPELLRDYSSDVSSHFALVFAVILATNQRSQKFRIEPGCPTTQAIVSGWWTTITDKLLCEAMSQKPFANILLSNRQLRRDSDVRIERHQGRVCQLLCVRVQAIELVRPAPDDHHVVEPRCEGSYKPLERLQIIDTIHRCFANSGLRARR